MTRPPLAVAAAPTNQTAEKNRNLNSRSNFLEKLRLGNPGVILNPGTNL